MRNKNVIKGLGLDQTRYIEKTQQIR